MGEPWSLALLQVLQNKEIQMSIVHLDIKYYVCTRLPLVSFQKAKDKENVDISKCKFFVQGY